MARILVLPCGSRADRRAPPWVQSRQERVAAFSGRARPRRRAAGCTRSGCAPRRARRWPPMTVSGATDTGMGSRSQRDRRRRRGRSARRAARPHLVEQRQSLRGASCQGPVLREDDEFVDGGNPQAKGRAAETWEPSLARAPSPRDVPCRRARRRNCGIQRQTSHSL